MARRADIQGDLNLDSTGFQRGLARAKKGAANFAKSATASFVRVGAAFAGISLVKSIAGLGTAAAETASKFEAVFGPATDRMNAKVQELRKTIPSTTAEMQDALATFAQMAKAFGLNEEAANMFSVEMVKIAGDIASFNNLPIEEAFTKIRSAISGEFEPMKALGIVINEARLKQEALNLAIWDGNGQMSAAQKALAVQSILIRDMGDANGDAAATADSAANQIKFLQNELQEMGVEIGTTILPSLVKLTEWAAGFVGWISKATEGIGEFIGRAAFMGGMTDDEFTAKLQLRSEGAFDGLKGRGGTIKSQELIAQRVKEIEEARAAAEKSAEAKRKQDEEALKNSKDLKAELEKQIATETDPIRKKSLEDRLNAQMKIVEAAGKLSSIEKPGTRKPKSAEKDFDKAQKEQKLGLNIERGEFESRQDFLLRRERARQAQIKLNEARRRVAAGGSTPDAAMIASLKAEAAGTVETETVKVNKQMAASLRTIESEMTSS